VIVLLGLDDGAFPRSSGIDGDDVLARDPCVGERDARSEDRQLLLDALVAAEERLIVLYTGADPVSGTERPPAVPVGELLDTVEVMTAVSRDDVVVRHPLQPYDARSFTGSPPFSFDPVNLAGAVRAGQPREAAPTRTPLPARTGPVALEDLITFLEHPAKAYLRLRLGITLPGEDDELQDALSTGLDALAEWAVGERLLQAQLRGMSQADAQRAEWLRGTLPPGALGDQALGRVGARVAPLVAAATPLLAAPPRAVDVRLDVAGRELRGTVNGVRGRQVVSVSYSTLAPKHRLRAWVLALALAAGGEGDGAVTVGRRKDSARTSTLTVPEDPAAILAQLLELYDAGLCEPLPLATKTSAAYAEARLGGNSPEQARESAQKAWTSDFGGDRDDKHHQYVWGEGAPLEALLAEPARDEERWSGEPSRFGALACLLWAPLRDAEQLS
jgi:exodeoxyribonuclease V gamma subunit